MKKLLLLISMLIMPNMAESKTVKFDPVRTFTITGPIGGEIVGIANKLVLLSEDNKEDINLLIESPGGSVFTGFIFLNAMKVAQSNGVKLNCIVPSYAASMAYIIFSFCDTRYTFKRSMLLFHPMGITFMGKINVPVSERIKKQFEILSKELDAELLEIMGMDKELYYSLNNDEFFWTSSELQKITKTGFITIVDSIEGLPKLFNLSVNNRAAKPAPTKKDKAAKKPKEVDTCNKCHKKPHKDKSSEIVFPEILEK